MSNDQAVPRLLPQVPKYWQFQSEVVEEFNVSKGCNEWEYCKGKFLESLPSATIHKIRRIQNRCLWGKYLLEKKWLNEKNHGTMNELELFHGCKGTAPMCISGSEEGFDVRHSKVGRWGIASYFAATAKYADRYAHVCMDGTKEIFFANVLLGEIYDYGKQRDESLRLPPIKLQQISSLVNSRYDSISGISKDTRIYMIYSNNKAYPTYIINYSCTES